MSKFSLSRTHETATMVFTMSPSILGERGDIVALYKPAGLIVHSDGRTVEPSLAQWVGEQLPSMWGVGEAWVSPQGERIAVHGIVHRLDRCTSGVILAAKTDDAFKELRKMFKERRVEKLYRAFVHGAMKDAEGEIVAEIARSSQAPKRWYARECERSDTRAAITHWTRLAGGEDPHAGTHVSYLEVSPKTGRTHQIRVHFSSIGHPLIADHLYGGEMEPVLGFTRPALHAYRIAFIYRGEPIVFEAPLPEDFASALDLLL